MHEVESLLSGYYAMSENGSHVSEQLSRVNQQINHVFAGLASSRPVPMDESTLKASLHELEWCRLCGASSIPCPLVCESTTFNASLAQLIGTSELTKGGASECWLGPNPHREGYGSGCEVKMLLALRRQKVPSSNSPRPLLTPTLQRPLVFLGDSIARSTHAAAQCQAARTSSGQVTGIAYRPMPSFNDRRYNRSAHLKALERVGLLDHTNKRFLLRAQSANATLVATLGIHYNDAPVNAAGRAAGVLEGALQMDRERFAEDVDVLFEYLERFAASCAGCRSVFMTAPFQHFPTSDGSFSPDVLNVSLRDAGLKSGGGCKPFSGRLSNASANHWRGDDVMARRKKYPHVTVIPLHILSRAWWDLKFGASGARPVPGRPQLASLILDCTHLCYSPFIYEPLWWALDAVASSIDY